jgi:hypothetical protein
MIKIRQYFSNQDRLDNYNKISKSKHKKRPLLEIWMDEKRRHTFQTRFYSNGVIKQKLLAFFYSKCAYCEDYMGNTKSYIEKPIWDWQTEHYRPKDGVKEDKTHIGYYWLAYECTNLLISCPICNSLLRKSNHFPLLPNTVRLKDEDFISNGKLVFKKCSIYQSEMKKEQPILLNPVLDNPREYIKFCKDGTIKGIDSDNRGQESIKIIGLDRDALKVRRKDVINEIRNEIQKSAKSVYDTSKPNKPDQKVFTGIIDRCLKKILNDIRNPKESFIGLRLTIFENFDEFILRNELPTTHKPYILPYKENLLEAYYYLKNKK